jgi:hypothetical protein
MCCKFWDFHSSDVSSQGLHPEDGGSTDLWNIGILHSITQYLKPEDLDLKDPML